MKEVKIRFQTADDVARFVNIVETYPGSIELECGKQVVDGKSLMGIINYGLNKDINMKVKSGESENLLLRTSFCSVE